MRIVVTGASGNIGTALLRRLSLEGDHHDVVGVCRRPPQGGEPYDRVEWHATDLADPGAARVLREAMVGADAVVHLAWAFQPMRDVAYLERANVDGSAAVFAAAQDAGVRHLVHLSSLGTYSPGSKATPADESWPRDGVASLPYSRQKVAVERHLDALDAAGTGDLRVARLRPALVVQGAAGGELLRLALPPFVPARMVRHLPVFPMDREFLVQVVHSDDVAAAVLAVLEHNASGAFNLAADLPLRRDDIAAVLGARPAHVPFALVRSAAAASFAAHVQPVDPGWLDLAWLVPFLDSSRARDELGWIPRHDAVSTLTELVAGMGVSAGTTSPALRPRNVPEQLLRLVTRGGVSKRRLP